MSTGTQSPLTTAQAGTVTTASSKGSRVVSIDVFRGLTMCLMIFVNDLAGVKGLPWWNYHMPARENFMTYVDMVFPTFLFIVGMSLPLAIKRRYELGSSTLVVWKHVILRTVSLLVLGLALANADLASPEHMPIGQNAWATWTLLGAILFWAVYPPSIRRKALFIGLRWFGFALMVIMFAIFRRVTKQGELAWLTTSYWEILGIIGWTYLAACFVYIPTRRWRFSPLFWFVLFLLFNIATAANYISWPDRLPLHFWPFSNGAFTQLVFAGAAVSSWFIGPQSLPTLRGKTVAALSFACFCALAGYLLSPLGISKIRATPTWCLYTAAAATLCFLLLYWLCDVNRKTRWATPFQPAGSNTLLTYLLPDLYYFTLADLLVIPGTHAGYPGVLRALLFTSLILLLSGFLTRLRIRLQL